MYAIRSYYVLFICEGVADFNVFLWGLVSIMLRCNDIDGIMNEMNNAMDMMHKMKDSCEKGYTPIMNEMLEEMIADKMSICIEKMMPEIQKENRTKFVLKLV